MRLLIAALLVLCFSISAPALAATNDQFSSDLSSLEDRFFLTEYPNETADQRLDRLDQFVFGRVRQGSTEDRMSSLLLAVPNVQSNSVQPGTASVPQTSAPLKAETPAIAATPPLASSSNQSVDYYPTVTALEEQIAHSTEQSMPLPQRLAGLETIAFGKPSTSNDLSKRVDRLKEYASKKNGGSDNYLTSSNAVGWTSGDTGLIAEVSSMEKEVFGQTYGRDDLSSRLARLEKNVLPQQPLQTFTPIAMRVNRLMTALGTSKSGPFNGGASPANEPPPNYFPGQTLATSNAMQPAQPAIATAQNAKQTKHHSFLHKLGVVLGDAGGMAARGMMNGGYGY